MLLLCSPHDVVLSNTANPVAGTNPPVRHHGPAQCCSQVMVWTPEKQLCHCPSPELLSLGTGSCTTLIWELAAAWGL